MILKQHNSGQQINSIYKINQRNSCYFKPRGLWYSVGNEWLEWCQDSMDGWIGKFNYELIIPPDCNILILDNIDKIIQFNNQFGSRDLLESNYIDWKKVSERYDGIEIAPHQNQLRFSLDIEWYYGWDIASGCIWNNNFKLKEIKDTVEVLTNI